MAENQGFSYFYDAAVRRVLLQAMRIFTMVKIQSAPDENGNVTESNVIVRYGDMSRMVSAILQGNSENTMLPANLISVAIKELKMAPHRRNNPYHVSTISVDERKFDSATSQYTTSVGDRYTIDRYMPVPYDLVVTASIWTTNTTTKLQILEQLLTIFNPTVDIQNTDNPLDWTMMESIELTDVQWSFRNLPIGTDPTHDVAVLTFNIPMWISPPAKVKRRKLIDTIVTTLYTMGQDDLDNIKLDHRFNLNEISGCFDDVFQEITTPGNLRVAIGSDGAGPTELKLLAADGVEDPSVTWSDLLAKFNILESKARIILKTDDDVESSDGDIYGEIIFEPASNSAHFSVVTDTLPSVLPFSPITQIIDPLTKYPGKGLPAPAIGQKYLLLSDIPDDTGLNPWGSVGARENDIIAFNGSTWEILFDAAATNEVVYVNSLSSFQHYKFSNGFWKHTYFGEYTPGYWRIIHNL